MKIYLCSMYQRREALKFSALKLAEAGIENTARWLTVDDQTCPADGAMMDVEDVRRSDAIICFTEHPAVGYTTGGRWVEFGLAMAWGIPIYIVGPKENVFCHIPAVKDFMFFDDALRAAQADFDAKDELDEKSERLDAAIVSDVKHVFGHGLKVLAMASIVSVMLIGIITALLTYYTLKTNALELRGLQEINRQ